MKTLLSTAFLAFGLLLATPASLHAAPQQRAYAPENLRTLSYNDQVRVISLEYTEQSSGRRVPDDQLRFYIDQINRSNWSFSRIKQDIAQSLTGNGVGPRPPQPPPVGGDKIHCESTNGRGQTCKTPWQGGSRLVRQLSGAACVEGRTWQSQQGQVYVGNGCRAEFAPRAQVLPPVSSTIRCTSANYSPRTCSTPWQGGSRLVRRISGSACTQNRTWGSRPGQVWVTQGCDADFGPASAPNPGTGYSVTCSSSGSQQTSCAWNSAYGRPSLLQKLSNAACIEGRTWGYQGRAIWVSHGCRARFSPQR